jgi:hypothetical protein
MADIARYVAETVDAIRTANPPAAPPAGSAPQQRRWSRGRNGRGSRFGNRRASTMPSQAARGAATSSGKPQAPTGAADPARAKSRRGRRDRNARAHGDRTAAKRRLDDRR